MAYQVSFDLMEAYFLNDKDISRSLRWYSVKYPDRQIPSRKVLKRLVNNLRTLGRFDKRPREPHQENHTINDEELDILIYFSAFPKTSVREGEHEIGVSKSKIHRVLKKHGFKSYVEGRLVQKLLPGDTERRKYFCLDIQARLLEDPNFLDNIIWTDESNFSNNGMYNRNNNRIWSKENPLRVTETNNQVRFSLNCWCGLLKNRVFLIHFYQGTLNTEKYLGILQILRDEIRNLSAAEQENLIFQQDGAPAHNSRRATDFLNECFPTWIGTNGPIRWPARSPDLTPLDFFFWGYVKDMLYKKRYENVGELQTELCHITSSVHHKMIRKSTGSGLIKRLAICVRQEGSHFEHLIN